MTCCGLMEELHRLAEKRSAEAFARESSRMLQAFKGRSDAIVPALEEISRDDPRYTVMVSSILGLLEGLPRRIESLAELARAENWSGCSCAAS